MTTSWVRVLLLLANLGLLGCYVGPEYVVTVKDTSKLNQYQRDTYARHNEMSSGFGQYFAGVAIGTDLDVDSNSIGTQSTFGWSMATQGGAGRTGRAGYGRVGSSSSGGLYSFRTSVSNLQEVKKRPRWMATFAANLGIVSMVPAAYGLTHFENESDITPQEHREMKPFLILGVAGMILGTGLYFWDLFSPVSSGHTVYSAGPKPKTSLSTDKSADSGASVAGGGAQ